MNQAKGTILEGKFLVILVIVSKSAKIQLDVPPLSTKMPQLATVTNIEEVHIHRVMANPDTHAILCQVYKILAAFVKNKVYEKNKIVRMQP